MLEIRPAGSSFPLAFILGELADVQLLVSSENARTSIIDSRRLREKIEDTVADRCTAQLKRERSLSQKFGPFPRNLCDLSKG